MFLSPTEDKAHAFLNQSQRDSRLLLPSRSQSHNISVPTQNIVYMEKCECSITGS